MKLLHAQVYHRHGARTPYPLSEDPAALDDGVSLSPAADWSGTTDAAAKHELALRVPITRASGAAVAFEDILTGEPQLLNGGAQAGDLTVQGTRDALALGSRLRQRYGGSDAAALLPDGWAASSPAALEVRSTPMRRTCETAMGVLTTLLGPADHPAATIVLSSDQIEDEYLVQDAHMDWSLWVAGSKAHMASSDAARTAALVAETERLTGWTLPSPRRGWLNSISAAGDELVCRLAHGVWEGGDEAEARELAERLDEELGHLYATCLAGGDGQQRASSLRAGMGRAWQDSCRRLRAAADEGPESSPHAGRKLCLFSAHDSTVFPLMMCLLPGWGMTEGRNDWAPFASDLAIELWDGDGSPLVRALYCGEVVAHAAADGDGYCTLGEWERLLQPVMGVAGEGARL